MDEKKYHYPSSDNERAIADKNREARACGLSYGAYIAGVSNVRNEQSTKGFISGGMNKSKKAGVERLLFSQSLVLERNLYEVDFCN